MTITPITHADVPAMFALSASIHRTLYAAWVPSGRRPDFDRRYADTATNRDTFARIMASRLKSRRWILLAAKDGDTLLGYCLVRRGQAGNAVIRGLFVAETARGHGIGGALLRAAMRDDTAYELMVVEPNAGAIGFYRHAGFVVRGERGSFFGITLLHMERPSLTKNGNYDRL